MTVLTIRNLPDEIYTQLQIRASKAGRSMEAEAQVILTAVVIQERQQLHPVDLQNWVEQLYGANKPARVVDRLIAERRQEAAQE